MPTDVLLSNSLHDFPSLRRCLMPGGLLSAISGILAGGILGFGAAEWSVLLDTFAGSCLVFCCLVFVSVQDLLIHWHKLPATLERLVSPPSVFCGFCCVLFVFVFGVLFGFCVSRFGTAMTSDCVMVRTPLSTPQGGILNMHLNNSFSSTTMCDDLARATEARDGKKSFI